MTGATMKTYVVCIDGTWNHPSQTDRDPEDRDDVESKTETNVLRVFRFLAGFLHPGTFDLRPTMIAPLNPRFNDEQQDLGAVLYLSGIGTNRGFLQRRFEGVTGAGTWERIRSGYRFLAERCTPDDQIFGFGFSRGAFAIRSLAGMIHNVGLPTVPRPIDDRELDDIVEAYGRSAGTTAQVSNYRPATVQFLGLWDTVSALKFDGDRYHGISPSSVGRVAHALALDEKRAVFAPEFWTASSTETLVNEVWFAGAHSNIGGGYADEELSNIALAWVVSEAVEAGLPKYPVYIDGWGRENTHGFARNSYEEFLKHVRIVGGLMRGAPRPRVIRKGQGIHASVFDRVEMVSASEYVTGRAVQPEALEGYIPTAVLADDHPFPNPRTQFAGIVAETPDYLSGKATTT
jgi:hypothetical protein